MARENENEGFLCAHCGQAVLPLSNGSYRNHCPQCLHSVHVDRIPGDRESHCGGLMAPVGLKFSGQKGWQIVHRCMICGAIRPNKAADSTVQPDDVVVLSHLPAWQDP